MNQTRSVSCPETAISRMKAMFDCQRIVTLSQVERPGPVRLPFALSRREKLGEMGPQLKGRLRKDATDVHAGDGERKEQMKRDADQRNCTLLRSSFLPGVVTAFLTPNLRDASKNSGPGSVSVEAESCLPAEDDLARTTSSAPEPVND